MTDHSAGTSAAASDIHRLLRDYPDFPRTGILYRDLAPVLADGTAFRRVVGELADGARSLSRPVDAVAGVEARGFLLAAAVAIELGCGVIPVRKAGKLPGSVLSEKYALEYGEDELQLAPDALAPGASVLLLDDVLATGGTLAAAARLIDRAGWSVARIGVVLELAALHGRRRLESYDVVSITSG